MPVIVFGVTVAMTAQAFLRDQMRELSNRGWEVHLVCSPHDGTDSFAKLRELPGVHVHALTMSRPPDPRRDLRSLKQWNSLLRHINPDVVMASTPKAGLLAMIAAKRQGIPTRIYHLRGLRAEGLSGVSAHISQASEKISIACASEVLVDSHSLLDKMRKERLLKAHQGTVLGRGSCCGIDTQHFRPPTPEERLDARNAFGYEANDIVIGFLGRIAPDKGVRELISAAATLHNNDPRSQLALVGPIEGLTTDEVRQAQNETFITMPGPTDDTRSAYWAFDIFCLPSYREGFPIAPLEAQACGLPLVTTSATGCIDAVEAGVTGLVVSPKDASALTNALTELIEDEPRRVAMGNHARMRMTDDFEASMVTQRTVDFVQSAFSTA